jgi:hypothetical protein
MRGIEEGLGGFDDERNEFNIALTSISGVSRDGNLQEVLEVSLRLNLEREDGQGGTVSYEKLRAKGHCTMRPTS